MNWTAKLRYWLDPPHPTGRSHARRIRIKVFLREEERRSAGGVRVNVGSASQRFGVKMLNVDLIAGREVNCVVDFRPRKRPLGHNGVPTGALWARSGSAVRMTSNPS